MRYRLTSLAKIVAAFVLMFTLVNCNRQEQVRDRDHPSDTTGTNTRLVLVYYLIDIGVGPK